MVERNASMNVGPSLVDQLRDGSAQARISVPLLTPRLELRPFEEPDIPGAIELMSDVEATRFIGGVRSPESTAQSVHRMREAFLSRGWGTLAVVRRSGGEYIGYCGVRPLINTSNVELAFALRRSAWGSGYATEASTAAIDAAFKHLPIQYILATVYPANRASVRVLTKVGMVVERSIFGAWPNDIALLLRLERGAWNTFINPAGKGLP
jgi:[ribosomal protein S5]-alanine N-acetyltransferase